MLQYYCTFSDRQREQLMWSRCINTKGYPGANIPCDLHMEHLNRRLKTVMRNLGANICPKSVQKAGKSLGAVQHVCHVFEEQTSSSVSSGAHPYPAFGKDFFTVLKALEEESVFVPQCKRHHEKFAYEHGQLMDRFSRKELLKKVQHTINKICPCP